MSLREHFQIDPEVTFLNHGSFGACPRPVFDVYQQWQRELELQPVDFIGRQRGALVEAAINALADYLHVDSQDLVFVTNATFGVNTVARSLDLKSGDEILTTDHEYGAVNLTWKYYAERAGAEYINRPMPLPMTTPEDFVETFWEGVTPKTRVIAISHISSPTALIFPIEEICKRAREAGIITVIDGAHAPGQIDLDLEAIGADFYTGNCHKWMCSPKGVGFLHIRREHQAVIDPIIISHGSQRENSFTQRHEWQGTRDISGLVTIPDVIKFQQEHDWPTVRQQCHELLNETRQRVKEISGLDPICPDGKTWYHQMASLPLPQIDLEAYRKMYPEYKVEVPIFPWNDHILMRVSIQAYNTKEDIDRLIYALKEIIANSV